MFSFLAWPRAFTTFTFIFTILTLSEARDESLFTSSVTYCTPPETLLIQRFEVTYFPANTSVSFNVSAASVEPNISVTANVFLNVYGMKPVNVTIDLCNILKGALCPLPMYNFTGADSLTLPQTLGVAQKIPIIAFKIPDLEGFAQLTLTEAKTGKVKACVQATLSNGWSAYQDGVESTTASLLLLALLAAGAFSILFSNNIIPIRLLELVYIYQAIASSALLNLNYPSVYRAFALNFAWSLGLISSADSPIQSAINQMRHLTGGKMSDIGANDAVGFVNRKLSPFNTIASPNSDAELSSGIANYLRAGFRETIKGEVQIVTANSPNVLQAGIPIYVNLLGIGTPNAFMTVFIIALCLVAISSAVFALGYGIVFLLKRRSSARQPSNFDYSSFVISWYLRLALILATPLLIFVFYQWTLRDSWLPVLLSVISLLAISAAIIYPSFRTFQVARRQSPYTLFLSSRHFSRFGCLYAQYCEERYWFFVPLVVAMFLRALFIAFAKGSGPAQLSLLIVVELVLMLSYLVLRPTRLKGSHVFTTYLAVTRFVCTTLMSAFLQSLGVMAIPRVVIGIVIALIWTGCVLVVIGNIVWNVVLSIRRRPQSDNSPVTPPSCSNRSMLEKGHGGSFDQHNDSTGDSSPTTSEFDGDSRSIEPARPLNPTPDHNVPLDPAVIQSHPVSPSGTTLSTMEAPKSTASGTTTYGSILPRRWSISQPTSPMGSSLGHSFGQAHRSSGTSSLAQPSSTPSESGHSGIRPSDLSRNAQNAQHQRYEDIQEENEQYLSSNHRLGIS